MFAQPLTDAFNPTSKLPETADSDVVGLGAAGDGEGAGEGAGVGGGAGVGEGVGVGDTGACCVDTGGGGGGDGWRVTGTWKIVLRLVRTHGCFGPRTWQTIRADRRKVGLWRAAASVAGAATPARMRRANR
jgi:hypothetical protein